MVTRSVMRAARRLSMVALYAIYAIHVSSAALGAQASGTSTTVPVYPPTSRGTQSDDIGGRRVPDPYRWLEATSSPGVRSWIAAQNAVTEAFLAQSPRRKEIRELLTRTWNHPRISAPFAAGERLFFFQNGGLENQPSLYVRDRTESQERVLIDPNAFSNEGFIAIVDQSPSPDGRYLAYSVSTLGSAARLLRVRDVKTAQDLSEELKGVKDSSVSWTRDERGFFYVRSDLATAAPVGTQSKTREAVLYHRTGHAQLDDQVIYENREHPEWELRAQISQDGQYLLIDARPGGDQHNRLYLIDLDNPNKPNLRAPLVTLFDVDDALYEFVANEGPVFYLRTTKGAPHGRLVAVDINTPDANQLTTVIRETFDPLVGVTRVQDRFVAHRLHDAHSVLELYTLDGGVRGIIPLPGVGTVSELHPRTDYRELYFTFTSVLQPPTPFRYDVDGKNLTSYVDAWADTTLSGYETTQLFFTSKDGTRVPMFITAQRGIRLDGTHATLLTGGGGFNASMTPTFAPGVAAWLALGGIYAVANVRGGGENGRAWHDAAVGERKQTAIDDFIAAAEFLIGQRYTKSSLLAVTGRGPAGLVAAAAMTQRPQLFGAAVFDDGLFDMLRFPYLETGPRWVSEYGSPDRAPDLHALLAYSPLHAVTTDATYPPTLMTVGDHDEVVAPSNSYKFAAGLQHTQSQSGPTLLRVDPDAGYGPGLPTGKLIALDADRWTFLVTALHLTAVMRSTP